MAASLLAQDSPPGAGRLTAIFVENRAGASLNDKVGMLEDFLTSRVTEKGFSVISRETAIDALKSYPTIETAVATEKASTVKVGSPPSQAGATVEAATSAATQLSGSSGVSTLDRVLSDNTSALRLAQNLGADYLLVASIASFVPGNRRVYDDGGIKTVNVTETLRVSYKVLEGSRGGSLIGDTVIASKTTRFTQSSQTENPDLLNELLLDAANQIAESIGKKQKNIAAAPIRAGLVEITVLCNMTDLANIPLSVADIRVAQDGTLLISTNRLGIHVLNATVEVNGTALGSAPGKFRVAPGLSKMRISREGFKDWDRTVNFSEGQTFNVALQMSEAGYARWKDNTAFLTGIEAGKKLTDGTVKMMEGLAQALRQSGYRIDSRSDVTANVEAKGKSLFDGLTIQPSIFK